MDGGNGQPNPLEWRERWRHTELKSSLSNLAQLDAIESAPAALCFASSGCRAYDEVLS
jgi:hypothetical protein